MIEPIPRLLVATEFAPNSPGGGPAVVRQMLRNWPAERLFWWSCLPEVDQTFGRQVAGHAVACIPEKLYPHQRWRQEKSWLLENVWVPWAAGHLGKTLRAVKPEVVWVIPHGWSISPMAKALPAGKTGFHVTVQDYMDNASYSARFGTARSRRLAAQADLLYTRANTRDATSHPMVADLRARTGANATQMLHAGMEAEDLDWLQTAPPGKVETIRIAHAGSILVENVFALFVAALAEIRHRLPRPVTLEFFGNHSFRSRAWFNPAWMNERGNFAAAELTKELRKCTWGFSPMALTDEDPHYNRMSFPTKFISYLAAGLPVITLGHPESSVVKMARAYDVGICLTVADAPSIGAQLLAALADGNPKAKYGAVIQRCALTEFDARRMRSLLHADFQTCAAVTRRNESA